MNLRKPIRSSLLLLVCLPDADSAQRMTLRQAQQAMFHSQPEVLAAAAEVERAQAKRAEVRASWMPSLDVFAGYALTTETGRIRLALPQIPGGAIERQIGDGDRLEAGADVSYALFTGGARLYQLQAAQAELAKAQAELDALKERLSLRLARLFLGWTLAQERLSIDRELVERTESQERQVQELVQAGQSAVSAALAAKALVASRRVAMLEAGVRADSLRRAVMELIGAKDSAVEPESVVLPEGWSNLEPTATRPELNAISSGRMVVDATRKAVSAGRWPHLSASAGWRIADPGLNLGGDGFMDYGQLALNMRWNLFDGLRRSSQAAQAESQGRRLGYERMRMARAFDSDATNAEKDSELAEARLEAAEAGLAAAEATAKETAALAERGLATLLQSEQARDRVLEARFAMSKARSDLLSARIRMRHSYGGRLEF